jgi:hypothetical protein
MSDVRLFPNNTPYLDEDEVEIICELLDRGYPDKAIIRELMNTFYPPEMPAARKHDKRRSFQLHINTVRGDRWNWCTKRSPIAMERAFCGYKDAWDELNFYERRDVVLRLQALYDTGRGHPIIDDPVEDDSWVAEYCRRVGIETGSIHYTFGRRKRIAAGKAKP